MFTILIALAAGVVGFLVGVAFACWTLDDDYEDDVEDTAHTAMTAPPWVHCAGKHPADRRRRGPH
jgi:hypothetical protein